MAPGTYRQAFLLQLKPPKNLEGEILLFPLCVRIDVYLTFCFWASSSFIPQVVPIVEKEVREQKFLAILKLLGFCFHLSEQTLYPGFIIIIIIIVIF